MKNIKFFKINIFKFITLFILLILYIFINCYIYVTNIASNLQKNVFRLHVIANSDEEEDQNLKYKIRDNLINYMNLLCLNSTSKEETIKIVSNNLDNFTHIANQTIIDNGFNYNASIEIGNFEFPTKKYGDIAFPAGYYDALEVKIGKASR